MESETKIESDPNPFPKFDILPGIGFIRRIGGVLISCIFFDDQPNTGAAVRLDKELWKDANK